MRNKWLMSLVALLIGGIAGWTVASSREDIANTSGLPIAGIGAGPNPTAIPSSTSEFRFTLNNLLKDHASLTAIHLQEVYEGKDTATSSQVLNTNTQQLADLISSKYGTDVRDEFMTMWENHINQYVNYTQGLKNNDSNKMNQAKKELANMAKQMGEFFHKVNPKVTTNDATRYINEHIDLTLSIVDAYVRQDQAAVINQMKAASDQSSRFAEFISRQ